MIVKKRRIAVLFPVFLGGGAEAVCLWLLEALKRDFDVTVITFSALNFEELNNLYGTELSQGDVCIIQPYSGTVILKFILNSHFGFSFRLHLLMRYFKTIRSEYDVAISAFSEMDLGAPGIQYIHFPVIGYGHEKAKTLFGYQDSALRKAYRWFCRRISQYSDESMKQNLTITNSHWTSNLIKKLYGIDSRVVYPPVKVSAPDISWEEREEGFVCISRLSPEKKIERAIEILRAVRLRGFNVHLHIITSGGNRRYEERFSDLVESEGPWIFLEKGPSRSRLSHTLARHKYGIHVAENEQFGIAVAEMVKARCIPFVPSKGGQVEIVGGNDLLSYDDTHQAVEKIVNILLDKNKQQRILTFLFQRTEIFGADVFQRQIYDIVSHFDGP